MSDNLQKYLPEFDEEAARQKLVGLSREQLLEMLIYAYKEKRVIAKLLGEELARTQQIKDILQQPSSLLNMPGIPSDEEIRRMLDN